MIVKVYPGFHRTAGEPHWLQRADEFVRLRKFLAELFIAVELRQQGSRIRKPIDLAANPVRGIAGRHSSWVGADIEQQTAKFRQAEPIRMGGQMPGEGMATGAPQRTVNKKQIVNQSFTLIG